MKKLLLIALTTNLISDVLFSGNSDLKHVKSVDDGDLRNLSYDLPIEIWIHIFTLYKGNPKNIFLTSTYFSDIAERYVKGFSLVKEIKSRNDYPRIRKVIRDLDDSYPRIRIDVVVDEESSDDLKELNKKHLYKVCRILFVMWKRDLTEVDRLEVIWHNVNKGSSHVNPMEGIKFLRCPKFRLHLDWLTGLHLGDAPVFVMDYLFNVIDGKNLTELRIPWVSNVKILEKFNLSSLEIDNHQYNIWVNNIEKVNLPALKKLKIPRVRMLNKFCSKGLTCIEICNDYSSDFPDNLLEAFPDLEKLTMKGMGNLKNIRFIKNCKNLKHLDVSNNDKITCVNFALLKEIPRLEYVNVTNNPRLKLKTKKEKTAYEALRARGVTIDGSVYLISCQS